MVRITLILEPEERNALYQLAQEQRRKPYHQASLIIRRELERQGLIEPSKPAKAEPALDTSTCTTDKDANTSA